MPVIALYILLLTIYLLYIPSSLSQTTGSTTYPAPKPTIRSTEKQETSSYTFFPQDQLYPVYIANPLRSTFSAQAMVFDKTSIANTSKKRFDLKVGANLGILKRSSHHRSWQLTLMGGFHGQFDIDHAEDNIGWDGLYGLSIDVRENSQLAYRLGLHHTSSHIGDELAERTGKQRINYTRQEARLGAVWSFAYFWQSYTEIGWGYGLRNDKFQKPWRGELGIQYEHPYYFFQKLGFYTALDLSSYEESNWDINTTIQIGIVSKLQERRWRIGVEYYDGRSQIGEFFQDSENYIGVGLWIDI